MNQTNCPNCGAPYDFNLTKCPYCGTNYFDLSFIDLDTTEPFYIKLNKTLAYNNTTHSCSISLRVLPTIGDIQTRCDYTNITTPDNKLITSYMDSFYTTLQLQFQVIPHPNLNIPSMIIQENCK